MVQYVNVTEASRLTGLSVHSLRRGVRSGRFTCIRVGDTPPWTITFQFGVFGSGTGK